MLLKGAVEAFKCLSVINVRDFRVLYCDERVCCRHDTFSIVCSV